MQMQGLLRWRRAAGYRVRVCGLLGLLAVVATAPIAGAGESDRKAALHGYCPASYLLTGKAVMGNAAHQSAFEGKLYYFAGAEAKQAFDADPKKYLPRFDGLCTCALGGSYGNRFWGDPEIFEIVDAKVYLFALERARRAYATDPARFIRKAEEVFKEPVLGGTCPVSYQHANKAVKGSESFSVVIEGYTYHLASTEAKATFLKEPGKYLPRYARYRLKHNVYCAQGVASNKRYPADPSIFSVVDAKTYLFWDAKAKAEFDANPTERIQQADAHWATLKDID